MGSAEEVPTPGYVRAKQNSAGKSERLGEQGSRWVRRVAAGGNYMSLDRPDVAFACKETCHGMSQPTVVEEERLERLGKYLKAHPSIPSTVEPSPRAPGGASEDGLARANLKP